MTQILDKMHEDPGIVLSVRVPPHGSGAMVSSGVGQVITGSVAGFTAAELLAKLPDHNSNVRR